MPADNQSELFTWVDENDHILGSITRREAHCGSKKIHRAVTILILNHDRLKLLLQQRSLTKDLNPGKWACGVGGHVTFGDTYERAAIRELEEELGITGVRINYITKHLYDMPSEREYMPIFEATIAEATHLNPDPTEVAEIRWCQINEVAKFVATHSMSADTIELLTQTGYLPKP